MKKVREPLNVGTTVVGKVISAPVKDVLEVLGVQLASVRMTKNSAAKKDTDLTKAVKDEMHKRWGEAKKDVPITFTGEQVDLTLSRNKDKEEVVTKAVMSKLTFKQIEDLVKNGTMVFNKEKLLAYIEEKKLDIKAEDIISKEPDSGSECLDYKVKIITPPVL